MSMNQPINPNQELTQEVVTEQPVAEVVEPVVEEVPVVEAQPVPQPTTQEEGTGTLAEQSPQEEQQVVEEVATNLAEDIISVPDIITALLTESLGLSEQSASTLVNLFIQDLMSDIQEGQQNAG